MTNVFSDFDYDGYPDTDPWGADEILPEWEDCTYCEGEGEVQDYRYGVGMIYIECPACEGQCGDFV